MNTITSEGIMITVETLFRSDLSEVDQNQFFFNYQIEIKNNNDFTVQLLHRDWYIFDSLKNPKTVSGEGVIGEQPILKPGKSFTYVSGCELYSDIGQMKGFYTFQNKITNELFEVKVPTFELMCNWRLN